MNPQGWLPIGGVAVTAFATTGQSEGSDTTDSNGHFRITGLTNRNWLVKATGQPPDFGVFILVPVTLIHSDLQTVTEDQHHAGFVGLVDNNGGIIVPDSDNRITFKDDGIINVKKAKIRKKGVSFFIVISSITITWLKNYFYSRYNQSWAKLQLFF